MHSGDVDRKVKYSHSSSFQHTKVSMNETVNGAKRSAV
jgi:hypothetical protein